MRSKARFGNRPAVDLAVEHRQRAEEKAPHQPEAQHQAEPGVQPGHGLLKILFHTRFSIGLR
jgi:hypothetical protein